MFMTFDRDAAQAAGVPVRRLDALVTILTALTIVLGMKIVGILLVSALLVIPAAAGLRSASRFRGAVLGAGLIAGLSIILGLASAYILDWPASGTIVIAAFLMFGITFVFRKK